MYQERERRLLKTSFPSKQPEQKKGKWAEVFGNDHPIHIEVGMGKGQFIIEMAKKEIQRSTISELRNILAC